MPTQCGFLFYVAGYNLLPSLFIVFFTLSQIWQWEPLQASFWQVPNILGLLPYFLAQKRYSRLIFLPEHWNQPFLQDISLLIPVSAENYLEIKMWLLYVLIAMGCYCFQIDQDRIELAVPGVRLVFSHLSLLIHCWPLSSQAFNEHLTRFNTCPIVITVRTTYAKKVMIPSKSDLHGPGKL